MRKKRFTFGFDKTTSGQPRRRRRRRALYIARRSLARYITLCILSRGGTQTGF